MKKILGFACLVIGILFSRYATGQEIRNAEYFFDNDPGVGKGKTITALTTSADSVDINTTVSTTGLASGFHNFFVRVQNASGKWSLYAGRNFFLYPNTQVASAQIDDAEYFFDNDPGLGKGTAVSVGTPADSVDISSNVSTAGLLTGFHSLFVRVKNDSGTWSLYTGRNFYLYPNTQVATAPINAAEYFFDTDPGLGKGTIVSVGTPADSVDVNTSASIAALTPGFHNFIVRVKNDSNTWSLYAGRTIYIDANASSVVRPIVRAEAFFDTDPGEGNGIPVSPSFAPADSVDLKRGTSAFGLALGLHNVNIRVQNDSGQWSLAESDTFRVEQHCKNINITASSGQVCAGDSATLTASGGTEYNWSNGDSTGIIKVSPATTDTFLVQINNIGCASDTTISLIINPLPTITITSQSNVLTASGATSYIWNTSGTNDTIIVHKTGRYSVTGTDSAGCSDTASYYITVTGIAQINSNSESISLFPNPNNGVFTLLYHLTAPNTELKIIDITGRTIYEQNLLGTEGTEQINSAALTNGLFFWQIVMDDQVAAKGKITVIK